ncbi:PREDICTED: probable receptor-like protein kinase At1g80640 isoform X2 [Camelina sativa]|uniref:Probable receptor-like protein kinase At1g80640 isoform X2 n=2 Tax=Camelina sativa TaxID=90675 RepID=A0ABM1QT59_CAMSA|nr:PREDICTED: probable receptor-like protein kinase At1g80640 isoform X2 [Camelina sativa]
MRQLVITALVLLQGYVLHQSTCVVSLTSQKSLPPQPSAFTPSLSPGYHKGEKGLHKQDSNNNMRLVILLAAAFSLVGIILVCSLLYWVCHRRRNLKGSGCGFTFSKKLDKETTKQGMVSLIDYDMIEKGTSGFKESNILGQGGFGCVYFSTLENNTQAAVKKLDCANEEAAMEFKSEVEILSKLKHPNIISLLGYSTNDTARFIVYELMPNVSLESHLHGASHGSTITWPMRMKIALDVSRGLEYLHEHCHPAIIHRDLKSSNILLDSNFNAKISDFGLAVVDGPKNKIHKLSGTVGYVAPEYLLDGKLTEKSDVYAFGVVLLELLLGKKPVEKLAPGECQSIITWAMPYLTDRTKLPGVIDPAIKDTMDLKHLYQVAAVALLCVQPEPSYRPLITDVLHSLIPLVPMELGGTLKTIKSTSSMDHC